MFFFRRPDKTAAALAMALCLAISSHCFGFDGTFAFGAGGVYSLLERNNGGDPAMVRGGGFRAHSVYGLTDSFGISLEGGRSWYQGYSVELAKAGDQMDTDSGEDESEEDTEQKEQERSSFSKKRSRTSSLSLSVVYALDVMRAMPFLSIGVTSFRIEDETDDKRTVDYEIGLRFCIGVEYMLSERFALGVLGGYDRFVTDTHDYKGDISLTARISFVIGAGRFKIR